MANSNTVIPAGLRADIMRKHMENKNTLTKPGSLYIGTGVQYESGNPDYFNGVQCYQTAELEPDAVAGKPLVSKGESGGVQQGIEWGQVATAGVGNQAIVGCASTSNPDPSHNSKIFHKSIGANDVADYSLGTDKLVYNAVLIGTSLFKLSQNADSSSYPPSTNQIQGLAYLSSTQINGNEITGSVVTATSYFNASSDERLKENIKNYDTENSVLDIPVKEFDYKSSGAHTIGFIAQDLQKLFPELVTENPEGYLGIQETKLVYLLMLEVKKLRKRVEELENK